MGYGADRARAAERLMQDYYLHARAVTRARASLLERLRPMRRRTKASPTVDLGKGVRLFDGHVTMAAAQELADDPALALRVFAACVRQEAPVLPFARDAITRMAARPGVVRARCARAPRRRRSSSSSSCTVPETRTRRGSIVGELHDVGLLLAMVPEFLPVTGRVHHDVYHVYTVDVHSVAAARSPAPARARRARARVPARRRASPPRSRGPRPLFLATLLHDVGKGWPDADGLAQEPLEGGRRPLRDDPAAPRPRRRRRGRGAPARARAPAHVPRGHAPRPRRPGHDRGVLPRACAGARGCAISTSSPSSDLSTTSPTAMTSWKARMLDELYFAAEAHLAGQRAARRRRARRARCARRCAAAWPGPPEPLEALLSTMPDRYLLANGPSRSSSTRGSSPSAAPRRRTSVG